MTGDCSVDERLSPTRDSVHIRSFSDLSLDDSMQLSFWMMYEGSTPSVQTLCGNRHVCTPDGIRALCVHHFPVLALIKPCVDTRKVSQEIDQQMSRDADMRLSCALRWR